MNDPGSLVYLGHEDTTRNSASSFLPGHATGLPFSKPLLNFDKFLLNVPLRKRHLTQTYAGRHSSL